MWIVSVYTITDTDLSQAIEFVYTVKTRICETDENPKCAQLVMGRIFISSS
jgi:hypothetical protein